MPQIQRGVLTSVLASAGDGIKGAVRGIVRLSDGASLEAFVKVIDAREVLVECVCALLGRARGLNVPEPLVVLVPGAFWSTGEDQVGFGSVAISHGSLRPWVANIGDTAVLRRLRSWAGIVPSACFDEWIANSDRHIGNILYDGRDEFWLIDHGFAIAPFLVADQPVSNKLFDVAVDGLGEPDKLMMKSKAMGVVDATLELPVQATLEPLPRDLMSDPDIGDIAAWLEARKTHLMRLTAARIPTKQNDLFTGGAGGA